MEVYARTRLICSCRPFSPNGIFKKLCAQKHVYISTPPEKPLHPHLGRQSRYRTVLLLKLRTLLRTLPALALGACPLSTLAQQATADTLPNAPSTTLVAEATTHPTLNLDPEAVLFSSSADPQNGEPPKKKKPVPDADVDAKVEVHAEDAEGQGAARPQAGNTDDLHAHLDQRREGETEGERKVQGDAAEVKIDAQPRLDRRGLAGFCRHSP